MTYIFSILFCCFLSFLGCYPDPGKHIQEAKEALHEEDTIEAIKYFEKAYEASLEDKFFITSVTNSYYSLVLSENRKNILLIDSDNKSFFIKNLETNSIIEEDLSDIILNTSLSPNANYATFVTKPDEEKEDCIISIFNIIEDKFYDKNFPTSCDDRVAILDSGYLFYRKEQNILFADIKNDKPPILWTNTTIEKKIKTFNEKANFVIGLNNIPYLSYGTMGIYTLYNLKNKKLTKIASNLSTEEIFFKPMNIFPGVIMGGAGQYQIVFLNPDMRDRVVSRYDAGVWRNISFSGTDTFYYINTNSRIYKHDKLQKQDQQLPFLAKDMQVNDKGEIFFLSIIGSAMRYNFEKLNPLSVKIFMKTLDLNMGK